MTVWSRIQSLFGRRHRADPLVRVTSAGFALLDPNTKAVTRIVLWADVSRIQTYKVDLLTIDCICLLFEFRSGGPPVQVSEEWAGFPDLFAPVSEAFPSIPQNWYAEIMTPAFEAKRTVLYEAHNVQSAAVV
jgi:hypothetical protein